MKGGNLFKLVTIVPLPTTHTTRGHDRRFLQLSTRVNAYLNSYFPSVIKLWNSLPPDVVHQTNLTDFKSNIAAWTIFICIIICVFMLIFEVCAVLIINQVLRIIKIAVKTDVKNGRI